jgi:hypothetical protein
MLLSEENYVTLCRVAMVIQNNQEYPLVRLGSIISDSGSDLTYYDRIVKWRQNLMCYLIYIEVA